MMYHYIYLIVNLLNGKYYIGKHSTNNLEDNYMGSGKAIKAAILKYGIDNFKKYILFFCDSAEEAYMYEKIMIKDWMINSSYCYNLRGGGDGPIFSEETKLKMSETAKNNMTEERRNKISIATKKGMAVKHDEISIKIAEANKRRQWKKESLKKMSDTLKKNYSTYTEDWYVKKHMAQNKIYKWITPEGNIVYANKCCVHRWHPDWKLIEE